jgi:Zn-dependent peptidase ImmA (M78 family)/transcriptional regulator with XRE-family HTH domain
VERLESVNTERIQWCCADMGITIDELAHEVGLSQAALKFLVSGEGGLTFNQLRSIAEHFGRGVLFFLEPTPVNPESFHSPQFRTLANQKPEISAKLKAFIERVEKQRDVYLSLREDLDGENRSEFAPPNLEGLSVEQAASATRQWLGLTNSNDFDTYREAIEARGILVFRSNGYNGKWQIAKENPILGFALYDQTCPVIVVKKQPWETQQCFTLMHELGHVLLHKASSIDDVNDMYSALGMEREANAFAGHLLVPNQLLNAIRDDERPNDVALFDAWLARHQITCGASVEVILRRLMDAGRLQARAYNAYRTWRDQQIYPEGDGGNRAYRNREPKHVFGDVFVKTVFDALYARNITLNKASDYLDRLKIKDLRKLEQYYAGL